MSIRVPVVLAIMLFLVVAAPVRGEEKERIGVADFDLTGNIMRQDREIGQSVADLLIAQLEDTYEVARRRDIAAAAAEARTIASSLFSKQNDATAIARAAGLRWFVCGKLYSFGDRVVIHAKLLDVKRQKFTQSTWTACDGVEAIPEALPEIVRKLSLVKRKRPAPLARPVARAPVDVPGLLEKLTEKDAGMRFAAAVELGRSGDAKAIGPLAKVLAADDDLFVRRAAARALGELGHLTAVPFLIEALTDKDYFVSITASKALEVLTGHDFGFGDGLTRGELEKVVAEATAWWEANRKQ